tara:strand:+ start:961 stop:1473 length:513 start_codon:yes stop_codon:yes gene_type:complete
MNRTPEQIAHLRTTADWLAEGAPHVQLSEDHVLAGFDFSAWIKSAPNTCGTTGCIAGAIVQFAYPEVTPGKKVSIFALKMDLPEIEGVSKDDELRIPEHAAYLTGLSEDEMALLFYPFSLAYYDDGMPAEYADSEDHYPLGWTHALPPKAIAKVLYHFIETGKIDWEIAR